MANMSGVVEAVARSGKSLKIGDVWYSAFAAPSLNGAKAGDKVSFTYTTTDKAGTTYHNIKGSVRIESGGAAEVTTPETAGAAPRAAFSPKGGRSFPVGPLDPERSIIRQNALTQANAAVKTYMGNKDSVKTLGDFVDGIIEIARKFEAYSAGDLDAAEAAEAVEKLRSSMEA
jgi:hypothetical protein